MEKKTCGESCCGNAGKAGGRPCPVCGKEGEAVSGDTVRKLLKPGCPAPWNIYFICRNAGCDAVYYRQGEVFKQADVSVPVYFKTGAEPVYACYCARVTKEQVLAAVKKTRSTRWAVVVKEITGAVPKCNCLEKNPLGKCCSKNAYAEAVAGCEVTHEPAKRSGDPLHGITLEEILTRLVKRHGWEEMGRRVPIRCFLHEPSIKSSLTFLRKTPWARQKVEAWFVREQLTYRPGSLDK